MTDDLMDEPDQPDPDNIIDLSDKQDRFAREYVVDLNATQAAIRAGYAENSAHVTGSRLLSNAKVFARINQLKTEQAERLNVSADTVILDLETLKAGAVEAGQFGPAIRASELQGKHINMFLDKSGNEQPTREIDWTAVLDNLAGDDPALRARLRHRA